MVKVYSYYNSNYWLVAISNINLKQKIHAVRNFKYNDILRSWGCFRVKITDIIYVYKISEEYVQVKQRESWIYSNNRIPTN